MTSSRITHVGTLLALLTATGGVVTVVGACVGDESQEPTSTTDANLCVSYCSEISKRCTGPSRQYRTDDECLAACGALPAGRTGDGQRNSVSCRLEQAKKAGSLSTCVEAGPFGGGVCGSRCEAFCAINAKNCTAERTDNKAPYGGEGDCIEECRAFAFDPAEGEGPDQAFDGGDTINCRSHHLILSLKDPVPHCSHTTVVSVRCTKGGDGGALDHDGGH